MSYPTVTNTFVSGTTAIHSQWNTNFSDVCSGLSDGTKDLKIANLTASNLVFASDIYSATLTDYSATSTITGFVSFTTKQIFYKKWDKIVFVYYNFAGTPNSTLMRFTLPLANVNYLTFIIPVFNLPYGAGAPNPFVGNLSFINSTTVDISMSIASLGTSESAAWYSGGGDPRYASGQFYYQTT